MYRLYSKKDAERNFFRIRVLDPAPINWIPLRRTESGKYICDKESRQFFITLDIGDLQEPGVQGIAFIRGVPAERFQCAAQTEIPWDLFRTQAILIEYSALGLTGNETSADKIDAALKKYKSDIVKFLSRETTKTIRDVRIIAKTEGNLLKILYSPSKSPADKISLNPEQCANLGICQRRLKEVREKYGETFAKLGEACVPDVEVYYKELDNFSQDLRAALTCIPWATGKTLSRDQHRSPKQMKSATSILQCLGHCEKWGEIKFESIQSALKFAKIPVFDSAKEFQKIQTSGEYASWLQAKIAKSQPSDRDTTEFLNNVEIHAPLTEEEVKKVDEVIEGDGRPFWNEGDKPQSGYWKFTIEEDSDDVVEMGEKNQIFKKVWTALGRYVPIEINVDTYSCEWVFISSAKSAEQNYKTIMSGKEPEEEEEEIEEEEETEEDEEDTDGKCFECKPLSDGSDEDMKIATVILSQLGANKFLAMTGAKKLMAIEQGLSFEIPSSEFLKNKIFKVRIILDPSDTYTLEFWSHKRGKEPELFEKLSDIYAEDLQRIFTEKTGLETHLDKQVKGKVSDGRCPKCKNLLSIDKKGEFCSRCRQYFVNGKMPPRDSDEKRKCFTFDGEVIEYHSAIAHQTLPEAEKEKAYLEREYRELAKKIGFPLDLKIVQEGEVYRVYGNNTVFNMNRFEESGKMPACPRIPHKASKSKRKQSIINADGKSEEIKEVNLSELETLDVSGETFLGRLNSLLEEQELPRICGIYMEVEQFDEDDVDDVIDEGYCEIGSNTCHSAEKVDADQKIYDLIQDNYEALGFRDDVRLTDIRYVNLLKKKDWKKRDLILFGKAEPKQYKADYPRKVEGLTIEQLDSLVKEGFIPLEAVVLLYDESPTMKDIRDFMAKFPQFTLSGGIWKDEYASIKLVLLKYEGKITPAMQKGFDELTVDFPTHSITKEPSKLQVQWDEV